MLFNEKRNPSTALEPSRQAKGAPGKLFYVTCYNNSGGTVYLQLYNQASGTPTGTPEWIVPIPATSTGWFDGGQAGYPCPTGILVALSTSATSFVSAGNVGWFSPVFA